MTQPRASIVIPARNEVKNIGVCLDAVFGQRYGWERAQWFAPQGVEAKDVWSFRRSNYFEHVGNEVRLMREKVGVIGKTSGVIPFIRVMDSLTLAISQGSLRRGSAAVYLPVSHPEIEEFIEIRRPTGGDPNRKALNLHHGLLISDAFMRAVENDEEWALTSPKDGAVQRKVSARHLWIRILTARIETGEPYLIFVDHVNKARPEHHKLGNLEVKTSNLCSEITLPTGVDKYGKQRTAVCCLSSLNLETYLEWHEHPTFIEDVMRFLDNVLEGFIQNAGSDFARATYAAMRERSVGLGVMGFHSFLQQNNIPLESVMAKVWNKKMFKHIRSQCDEASHKLADERGACPDAADYGIKERFSHKLAIAPTASISIICGGASPGIEPSAANVYNHKTLSGSFVVRNPYLEKVLEQKGKNDEDTWTSIMTSQGSVMHLDCLDDHEKAVFKTAFELDQRWLVEHAADHRVEQLLDGGGTAVERRRRRQNDRPGASDLRHVLQVHQRQRRIARHQQRAQPRALGLVAARQSQVIGLALDGEFDDAEALAHQVHSAEGRKLGQDGLQGMQYSLLLRLIPNH